MGLVSRQSFIFALTVACVAGLPAAFIDKVTTGPANVTVNPKPDGSGFHVHVDFPSGQGSSSGRIKLNLEKPNDVTFGKNFKVLFHGGNGIEDHTAAVQAAASQVYVDNEQKTAVRVEATHDGKFKINGFLNTHQIKHDGETHVLVDGSEAEGDLKNDYIDLNVKLTPGPQTRAGITTASPEVLCLFDFSKYKQFYGSSVAIQDYVSIFFRAVQNRFDTIRDPKITFTLVGLVIFGAREYQPFVEAGKMDEDDAYDAAVVLTEMISWIRKHQDMLPYFDMVTLLTAEKFMNKDNYGEDYIHILGVAYLGGACNKTYMGASIVTDSGNWEGANTAAHEFAHTLNSPHDPKRGSFACDWDLGYIMSYVRLGLGSESQFYFSQCSKNSMKEYINSQEGSCLRTTNSYTDTLPISQTNPGDRLSLDAQCEIHFGPTARSFYGRSGDLDMLCAELLCQIGELGRTTSIIPLDNSPCAPNKVCRNGKCVNENGGLSML